MRCVQHAEGIVLLNILYNANFLILKNAVVSGDSIGLWESEYLPPTTLYRYKSLISQNANLSNFGIAFDPAMHNKNPTKRLPAKAGGLAPGAED